MRTIDLIGSAVSNTFRSKTRTILTILGTGLLNFNPEFY